jgi:proline dehydrogenase
MPRRFLRTFFLSLSRASLARHVITRWRLTRRISARFVAGETLQEALDAIRRLNGRGINATLDHLGENTTNEQEAREATAEVLQALEGIEQSGVRANVSIKLSQFGLVLDENLCRENLLPIFNRARTLGNFIRIDMEDSSLTDATIRIWDWAVDEGFDQVGIVIQSYLYRSRDDVCHILERGGRIRLCKGAYDEPAAVAYPNKADVDKNFDHLASLMFEGTEKIGSPQIAEQGRIPPIPALATHDEARIQFAKQEARRQGLPDRALEFQMLYGIRRDLQDQLVKQGYPVRVYVPYGKQWYPYFMRRLAERPANLWFLLANYFRG